MGLLFTEVEHADRLRSTYPEATAEAVRGHDEAVRVAVEGSGGQMVLTGGEGDSTFSVFPEPGQAAAAALRLALAVEGLPVAGTNVRLRVRAAVHVGEAEARDGGFYGLDLNRCARLRSICHGGQVLFSEAAARASAGHLPTQASLVDLGVHRLKDIEVPERVYQLRHPGLEATFPPLRSLDRARHNLPDQSTTFIGREEEMASVREELTRAQLVTLTGTGGSGKTRLSLEVARSMLDEYADGVWFVELAPLRSAALVPNHVGAAMGLRDEPGRSMVDTLLDHLRTKQLLLILDNCEHLIDAVADLLDRLLECPGVRLLATSQRPLGCAGEVLWRVPSMAVPDASVGASVAALEYASVHLFVERARSVDPTFSLTASNRDAVLQVLRQLDGIPLAIELAAARVATVPPAELADRLGERFRLLVGGDARAMPRQRTLRALVDWSFELLSRPEQALLERLSMFTGGCSLEAAEQVCAGGPVLADEVLGLLDALAAKSLLVASLEGESMRYRLLETIRHYASDRLSESGDRPSMVEIYTSWYVSLGESARTGLFMPDQADWHDVLEVELDNLRNVLGMTRAEGRSEETFRLASAVWRFWWIRGYLGEGRQWLDGVLTARNVSPVVHAEALHAAGALAWDQGDFRAARYLLSAAHSRFLELGDLAGQVRANFKLACVLGLQGHSATAREMLDRCMRESQELGDPQLAAESVATLGRLALQEGEIEEAELLWQDGLASYRAAGDMWGVMASLGDLGEAVLRRGDLQAARPLLDESLDLARNMKDKWRIAQCLATLGQLAAIQGDLERARRLHHGALGVRREIGERVGLADSLEDLALLAGADGEHSTQMRVLGAVDALRSELGVPLRPLREQARAEPVAEAVRSLGEEGARDAYREGGLLGVDGAVALVQPANADAATVAA